MIKIKPLNAESEEDSGSEETLVLQHIALQEYAKALDFQKKGNLTDATQLLKDLLDTELLYNVKKPVDGEEESLYNLKYLCYKNLASFLNTAGDIEASINAYVSALELDDTDITVWYRYGLVCMKGKHYEIALHAFQQGLEKNPRYWPCLDKKVLLLLALNYKEDCIATIHNALKLDPGYCRGIVYRRHIYMVYRHMREYMVYLNPIYKWNEEDDDPIDEEKSKKLIKEADDICEQFIEQQKAETFINIVPNLKLKKPITQLSWESVGDSLVHMHKFMTEHCFSHACFIEILYEKENTESKMDISEELTNSNMIDSKEDNIIDNKETTDTESENKKDVTDKDKSIVENENMEVNSDVAPSESASENVSQNKTQKKVPGRRRGSTVVHETWDWCKPKPTRKKGSKDDTIYGTLHKLVPASLNLETIKEKDNQDAEMSSDTDLGKLFQENNETIQDEEYFGSENERKDVESFIDKYIENSKDIIDMLNDYLNILCHKWHFKWPENLLKVYTEASKCYSTHIDVPACTDDNLQELIHYTSVNMLTQEIMVNEKLNSVLEEVTAHDLGVVESIRIILTFKPTIYHSTDCLEMILRFLWLKLHIHKLNKCEDLALECLYHLLSEFKAMGEFQDTYDLNIVNFTYKPVINNKVILEYVKLFEMNNELLTAMDLYSQNNYEEVLTILTESFDHCKVSSREQEEMPLDFAVHLTLILDTFWALDKVDYCFKWSFICLHQALKHYFRVTSGSPNYDKWTLTVTKILKTIDHILSTVGVSCLESLTQKELSQGIDDLIRIIGHQMETVKSDIPLDAISPWIIMYYILQREEEQERNKPVTDRDGSDYSDEIPNPLMVLFEAHDKLGKKNMCATSDARLLFFILDTIVPRLRSPLLATALSQLNLYMEQCVYCLYGHCTKKNKSKLKDHKATPLTLDWKRAQQLYEIFRPLALPQQTVKSAIVAETESLFCRILSLLPEENNPSKYVPEIEKYIKGQIDKLPVFPSLLPYQMKDIYVFLADYYFKKEDYTMSIKYNILDVVVNNDRFISWSHIALAKAANLGNDLKVYKNFKNESEFLDPAKETIRCFKRSLEIDPSTSYMWVKYGNFVYTVHSFCSRLLKQLSESLSMEEYGALEKQKEEFLDITYKCFTKVEELNRSLDATKSNEDKKNWLLYYMLGKVAKKKNYKPSVYLKFYMEGVKSLQEAEATYPSKINYNTPTYLSMQVLELQYRIHASILKYIELHENKPIPSSVGKEFLFYIEGWKRVSFTKKNKKQNGSETENETKLDEQHSATNTLKRTTSDSGEEETHEAKRIKIDSVSATAKQTIYDSEQNTVSKASSLQDSDEIKDNKEVDNNGSFVPSMEKCTSLKSENTVSEENPGIDKKEESSSSSSSLSSSGPCSSDSSSDNSSSSSTNSDTSSKSSEDSRPLSDEEILKIVSACLDALEDCVSRYSRHYKALYRLAHYHFYYTKGRDIERCRDIMLSTFVSRSGKKLNGLFFERKEKNFFNNIWMIKCEDVARPGAYPFHMNRAALLTFEILKEIDDHKTLLELSLHLHRTPDLDKTYLRDSDRKDLAHQALSLCIQSLRGQLVKFSQQVDLKSNEVERQALKSFMVDIYEAHTRVQKQLNSKQFTSLIVDAYKLISTTPIAKNVNLVDISLKYCYALKKVNNKNKKQVSKTIENPEPIRATTKPTKIDMKAQSAPVSSSGMPKLSAPDITAAFQNYMPILNDPILSQQTAAALSLSYLSNFSALAEYTSLQNNLQSSLQTSLQNSFQAEFYRQFLEQSFSSYGIPPPKKKRGPKPNLNRSVSSGPIPMKPTKPYPSAVTSVSKHTPTTVITSLSKSASNSLTPSMGTVLPTLPPSMNANLSSFGGHVAHSGIHSSAPQAHMSTTASASSSMHSKSSIQHQQVSPGKTLQEKLAERQKSMPPIKTSQEINASISRLPSSLTITKTSVPKQAIIAQGKKPEPKKSLIFGDSEIRPKPITTDEVIVLDDD